MSKFRPNAIMSMRYRAIIPTRTIISNLNEQKQEITPSSRKRLERSLTLGRATPPGDAGHVLALLGNRTDRDYPIYRDATLPDTDATLCSALYDLDRRELRIYWGNPVREPEKCLQIAM